MTVVRRKNLSRILGGYDHDKRNHSLIASFARGTHKYLLWSDTAFFISSELWVNDGAGILLQTWKHRKKFRKTPTKNTVQVQDITYLNNFMGNGGKVKKELLGS